MPGILALDLSTVTGWAYRSSPAAAPVYGRFELPRKRGKKDHNTGEYLAAFRSHLRRLVEEYQPADVVFEAPIIVERKDRFGRPVRQSVQSLRKLYSLAGLTEMFCADAGIRCAEAKMQRARKHFVGHGRPGSNRDEIKASIINACRLRGWTPQDDNVADALCVLDYSAHLIWRDHPDLAFEHWKRGAA